MSFPHPADTMTEEEFLSLPESMERVEFIDGEVIVAPSPSPLHQDVLLELATEFKLWARKNPPAYIGVAPLDLRIVPGRIVQPDLFVFVGGRPRVERVITGTPDLVLEVLSQKKSYDRLMKRSLYAEARVREYWMVDVDDRRIEIVHPDGASSTHDDEATSEVAPGLRIRLADVLR